MPLIVSPLQSNTKQQNGTCFRSFHAGHPGCGSFHGRTPGAGEFPIDFLESRLAKLKKATTPGEKNFMPMTLLKRHLARKFFVFEQRDCIAILRASWTRSAPTIKTVRRRHHDSAPTFPPFRISPAAFLRNQAEPDCACKHPPAEYLETVIFLHAESRVMPGIYRNMNVAMCAQFC